MEISKSEFEKFLSVATSSQVEVYEKVAPCLTTAYEECKTDILGHEGTQAAEDGQHEQLTVAVKRWVCLKAFLSIFRQLDLVLTPTGFGVVSTNQMAPASKQRVDALIGQLRDGILVAEGQLLENLFGISGWGASPQALEKIDNLFFDFRMLRKYQGPAASHLDWQPAQRLIGEADEMLRRKLSNEYMESLLNKVRSGSCEAADLTIIFICRRIISMWIAGDQEGVKLKMRRLLATLDANLETYSIYAQHGYPVNHHENFQNTQHASAFIFG